MSIKRYAARRDANEKDLKDTAVRLGWWLIRTNQPGDFLGWFRGRWHPIEIKRPDKEGHADEYTPAQNAWRAEADRRGARILTWRTADDVLAASRSSDLL